MKILKTVINHEVWLGTDGTATTHYLDRNESGLRIHVFQLKDVSPVKITLIEGDATQGVFTTHVSFTRHRPSEDVIKATVEHLVKVAAGLQK